MFRNTPWYRGWVLRFPIPTAGGAFTEVLTFSRSVYELRTGSLKRNPEGLRGVLKQRRRKRVRAAVSYRQGWANYRGKRIQ